MNNSAFGKTIEKLRKSIKVRLINNAKDYLRYISKPSFVSQMIFGENCVAIHEIKPVLTINKPIYLGFIILDLSKYLMYELHYECIKNIYISTLLFTDTDSLLYEIDTEDVYEDFHKNKIFLDFSDYPHHSEFFDLANKKVVGKMKDEFKWTVISEFIGLKSNMYSLIAAENEKIKKANGMNKNAVKNIRHKEFVIVLFNKKMIRHKMKRIQSKLHRIGTYDVFKTSLSYFDGKDTC